MPHTVMSEKGKEIRDLLGKISHPLAEVRTRSLRSIVFKLSNGLLSYCELAKEKEFLAHLLEWFNHQEWLMEPQVLTLLQQLAQYDSAARTLVSIGGVEFLSQLRGHCEPSLHPLIDDTLEHLLQVPLSSTTVGSSELVESGCSASSFNTEMTTDMGSYHSQHTTAQTLQDTPKSTHPHHNMQHVHIATPDQLSEGELSRDGQVESQPVLWAGNHTPSSSWTQAALNIKGGNQYTAGNGHLEMLTSAQYCGRGLHYLYGESSVEPDSPRLTAGEGELRGDLHVQATAEDVGEDCLFPWLRLTVKDCHSLATTQSRLLSPSPDTVLRSCHFIHDVLLEDFPAQIFLQRPLILKGLLQVSGQGVSGSLPAASYSALLCLLKLTRKLRVRIKQRGDHSMRSVDKLILSSQDYKILDTRPRSHNLPSQSYDQLEELTVEMLEQLQSEQFFLDQYCSTILTNTAPLLPGYLNRHLTWTTTDGEEVPVGRGQDHSVAAHLAVAMELLSAVVELKETQGVVANDRDTLTQVALVYKSIESLSSALSQCLSKWRRVGSSQGKAVSPLLQLVCCSTLQLAYSLSRLIQGVSLAEKSGGYPWWTNCSSLSGVVQELMMSGVLAVTLPHLQDSLLPLFQLMDSPTARLFCKVKNMAKSFQKMAQFLKVTANSGKSDVSFKIGLAVDSLEGLWFTSNADFISKAISLSFDVLTGASVESVEWSKAKLLLASLLSHGSNPTMETAYQHAVRIMLEVLPGSKDQSASGSGDSSFFNHVLLDTDILAQVCCHGAVSESDTVVQLSRQLLTRLLSQREEPCWPELRQLLLKWLPFIEVSASEDTKLFESLKELVSHRGESDQLYHLEKLQCCLRLLFSQCTEQRVWSFTQLTRMIVAQTEQQSCPSTQHHFIHSSSPLHDLLTTPISINGHTTLNKSRSFQLEDVLKLRHILRSATMDITLKKAALEQAALILQDQSLHEQLMEEGFSDDLFDLLCPLLDPSPPSPSTEDDTLTTPCIQCLSLLTNSSHSLRQELANNYKFLLGLFKVCLVNPKDKDLLHCTSKLFVSLLFVTVTRFDDDGPKLPSSIAKRLKLPFPVETYDDTDSNHSTPCPLDPGQLTSEPLLSMLRTYYHVALAGSVSELVNAYESGNEQLFSPNRNNKLSISNHDMKSLKCLQMRLPLDDLATLSSHQEVNKTIQLTSVMVICSPLVHMHNSDGHATDWTKGVEKFLVVEPRTTKDVELLSSVLQFLTSLLAVEMHSSSVQTPTIVTSAHSLVEASQLVWLVKITCHEGAVCVQLVHSCLQNKQNSIHQRTLLQTIVQFYATITDVVFGCCLVGVDDLKGIDLVSLCEALCECVQVEGSPDHHDLALMEGVLKSMLNVTSSCHLPTLIGRNTALILKLMMSLRQVLCLFSCGQGMTVASFMGKGVISQAALSLTHLIQSSCCFSMPQGWWCKWMSGSPANSFTWLNSLLIDRDPKVRYAGYSLLALFCSKPELVDLVVSHWSSLDPFGLWGLCLRTALDPTNCVLVRQQAFFVLVNLSAVCSNERKWNELLTFTSEELSVNSGRALELLLETHKLFSLLLSTVKIQGLAQLKTKLYSAESVDVVTASNGDDPLPTESYYPQSDCMNNGDTQHMGNDSPPLSYPAHQHRGIEGVTSVCIACCNPYVISGWCQLVNNLLQTFPDLIGAYVHNYCVIASLTSILEPIYLKQFFQKGIHVSIHFKWWLRMYTDAIDLLKTTVLLKLDGSLPLLTEKETVLALGGILSVGSEQTTADQYSDGDCFQLCSSVLSLIQVMVQKSTLSTKHLIFSAMQINWRRFVELLLCGFKLDPYLQSLRHWDLRKHGLTLLNSLLLHCFQPGGRQGADEGVHQSQENTAHKVLVTHMTRLLDGTVDDDKVAKQLATPSGSQLCSSLLQAYEGTSSTLPRERWLVGRSLGLLLSCSVSAKQTALRDGLLEVLIEELKALHTKLCMESLEDHTHHSKRSKESPTVDKLVAVTNLLRNFQHKSSDVKLACVKSGLPAVIHKMWPSCTVNRQILVSVLKMLCVLTAQHPAGRASLTAYVKGSNCSLLQSVLKTATHTLTSHTSCTSAKMPSPYSEILYAMFSLLANCALSHECRAVLKKTGFMSAFTSLNPKSEKALMFNDTRHTSVKLSSLWINFLVNLSFSNDGQQMIIKQPESIDILLDVYNSNCDAQLHCLLILRNLCFYGPSKTLLASNENFLSIMSSVLDNWPSDKKRVALAASAVWALVYNSAKIRHSLKKAGLFDRLSDLRSSLQAEIESSDVDVELRRRTFMSIAQTLNIIAL